MPQNNQKTSDLQTPAAHPKLHQNMPQIDVLILFLSK